MQMVLRPWPLLRVGRIRPKGKQGVTLSDTGAEAPRGVQSSGAPSTVTDLTWCHSYS